MPWTFKKDMVSLNSMAPVSGALLVLLDLVSSLVSLPFVRKASALKIDWVPVPSPFKPVDLRSFLMYRG